MGGHQVCRYMNMYIYKYRLRQLSFSKKRHTNTDSSTPQRSSSNAQMRGMCDGLTVGTASYGNFQPNKCFFFGNGWLVWFGRAVVIDLN